MSLPELSNVNSQSFVSKMWNYDGGKARRRAFIMATVTTVALTPGITWHYYSWYHASQWRVWLQDWPPRIRVPGLPYYWIGTMVAGALIAIMANSVTAFFATSVCRKNIEKQIRSGVFFALLFPGIAPLLVELHTARRYWNEVDSPIVMAMFLWGPLVAGAVTGVLSPKFRAKCVHIERPRRAFPPIRYYAKIGYLKLAAGLRTAIMVATIVITPFAIARLVAFILGY